MESAIRVIFQVSFWVGLAWFFLLLVETRFQRSAERFKHRFRFRVQRMNSYRKFWIIRHLDRLLYLTAKNFQPGASAVRFLLRSLYLFLTVFVILLVIEGVPRFAYRNPFEAHDPEISSIPVTAAFIIALVFSAIPYVVLRLRYSQNVVKASYDLAEVVKIISRHAHLPVSSALRHTADDLPAGNVLKRPLYMLASVFSSYGSFDELQAEALRFSSAIGTTFATQFVMDLLFFEKEGTQHFKRSLLFLNDSIEWQRQAILRAKDENRDAIALGLWINAFVIVLTSIFAIRFLTLRVFLKLLFQTEIGLYLMTFVLTSFVIAFFIGRVLSRPKLDY